MATDPVTDQTIARRLLERAVQWEEAPALTEAEVDDLMLMAGSDDDGDTVYTGAGLNAAASAGWAWKAGKVAADFTVALEDGVKFNRSEVHAMCMKHKADYGSGRSSVLGTPRRRETIVSIPLVTDIGEVS